MADQLRVLHTASRLCAIPSRAVGETETHWRADQLIPFDTGKVGHHSFSRYRHLTVDHCARWITNCSIEM